MVSKKFAIAKQLGGKRVITNKGEEIGRLSDILIEEKSGKIDAFVLEPNNDSRLARELTKDRAITVPYKAVFAVSDVIVVDETMLV
jgi:sporulation protein YlmC with PRC-barrel domain